jgi:DNA-directed RNA polymerase subunit M/transcription elongation factor TFIIS
MCISRWPRLSTSAFTCCPLHQANGCQTAGDLCPDELFEEKAMAKIAKTADRKKIMDTTKSTDCPKCGKPTRIVKRVKDRERDIPGGMYISCSACEFYEKL